MFDGVTLGNIPATGCQMVAYYINGKYAVKSVAEVEARFPVKTHSLVPIDVLGTRANFARVADVESGDIQASDLEAWITEWNATNPAYHTGGRPVPYCDRSTIPDVRIGTGKYVLGRDYYLWVSTLDNSLFPDGGSEILNGETYTTREVVACQYKTVDNLYDVSSVYSDQWLPIG
jgi:hypothetical protein